MTGEELEDTNGEIKYQKRSDVYYY